MKYLWAPWRMSYILEAKPKGCFFCKNIKEKKNKKNLILYQGKYNFVSMNRYPYTHGHLMIVPNRHCIDLDQMEIEESKEFFDLTKLSLRVLRKTLHPHGFNIGMNLGKIGGAGEEHLHLHVVPRWTGDTNFMPVIGGTKILPEYLEKTCQKLQTSFKQQLKKKRIPKGG